MRLIELTQEKVAIVDDNDYYELTRHKWCFNGHYAMRTESGKTYYMHREILRLKINDDNAQTDHINRNKLDNRRVNLRIVNRASNNHNSSLYSNNKSGYKGVIAWKGKFRAQVHKAGEPIHYLGTFNTAEDAAKAYNECALRVLGPNVWLNPVK